MKSIERRFKKIKRQNPLFSTYLSFFYAVRGQKFNRRAISKWFNKLVDENDYGDGEKKGTLDWLVKFSNIPEDNQKRSSSAS